MKKKLKPNYAYRFLLDVPSKLDDIRNLLREGKVFDADIQIEEMKKDCQIAMMKELGG